MGKISSASNSSDSTGFVVTSVKSASKARSTLTGAAFAAAMALWSPQAMAENPFESNQSLNPNNTASTLVTNQTNNRVQSVLPAKNATNAYQVANTYQEGRPAPDTFAPVNNKDSSAMNPTMLLNNAKGENTFGDATVRYSVESSSQYGVVVRGDIVKMFGDDAAADIEVAVGPKQREILVKAGWRVSENGMLRVTAHQLIQLMTFGFESGESSTWMNQSQFGATLRIKWSKSWLDFLEINGYVTKSDSKKLEDKLFEIDTPALLTLMRDPRAIAGQTTVGTSGSMQIRVGTNGTVYMTFGVEGTKRDTYVETPWKIHGTAAIGGNYNFDNGYRVGGDLRTDGSGAQVWARFGKDFGDFSVDLLVQKSILTQNTGVVGKNDLRVGVGIEVPFGGPKKPRQQTSISSADTESAMSSEDAEDALPKSVIFSDWEQKQRAENPKFDLDKYAANTIATSATPAYLAHAERMNKISEPDTAAKASELRKFVQLDASYKQRYVNASIDETRKPTVEFQLEKTEGMSATIDIATQVLNYNLGVELGMLKSALNSSTMAPIMGSIFTLSGTHLLIDTKELKTNLRKESTASNPDTIVLTTSTVTVSFEAWNGSVHIRGMRIAKIDHPSVELKPTISSISTTGFQCGNNLADLDGIDDIKCVVWTAVPGPNGTTVRGTKVYEWVPGVVSGLSQNTNYLIYTSAIVVNGSTNARNILLSPEISVKTLTSPANTAPTANDFTLATTITAAVNGSWLTLASAADINGDTLVASVKTQGTKGVLSISGNTLTYTPNASQSGTDTGVITISDGKGGTKDVTVSLSGINTVANTAPTANDFTLATTITAAVNGSWLTLASAADINGDTLVASVKTQGTKGVLSISGNTLTYTPNASQSGTDTGVITISDGKGGTKDVTVSLSGINTVANTAPTANDFTLATTITAAVNGSWLTLASAADINGDTLVASVKTQGTKGVLSISGNTLTYTPNASQSGTDTGVITISDGKGGTKDVTVSLSGINTVANTAPTANDFTLATTITAAVNGSWLTLASAADINGDTLVASVKTQGTKGVLSISGNTLTYTPNASQSGTDTGVITISDGKGGTKDVTVSLSGINTVANTAPTANDFTLATTITAAVNGSWLTLASAADINGDTLVASVKTQGTKGVLSISGNTLTYTPNASQSGTDTGVITISDGKGGNKDVTVSLSGISTTVPFSPSGLGYVADTGSSSSDGITNNAQINWTASANTTSYEVSINGTSWTDIGNVTTYNFGPLLPQGVSTLYVRSKNAFGTSVGVSTISINYDNTGALKNSQSVVMTNLSSTYTGNTITANETIATTSNARLIYASGGADVGAGSVVVTGKSGSTVTFDITTPASLTGAIRVAIDVTDTAGNPSTLVSTPTTPTALATVPSSAPSTLALSGDSGAPGDNITNNANASWATVGDATGYDVRVNSGSWTDVGAATSFNFGTLSLVQGSNVLEVRAKNANGVSLVTKTLTITYDNVSLSKSSQSVVMTNLSSTYTGNTMTANENLGSATNARLVYAATGFDVGAGSVTITGMSGSTVTFDIITPASVSGAIRVAMDTTDTAGNATLLLSTPTTPTAANTAPTASDVTISAGGGGTVSNNLIASISDAQQASGTLNIVVDSGPSRGGLSWAGTSFTYVATDVFIWSDSFTYHVVDSGGLSSTTKTVTIIGIDSI